MTGGYYDPLCHQYSFGGTPWPSVTQALDAAGLIDKRWYPTPTGDGTGPTDRGRRVHRFTMARDMMGTASGLVVPPDIGAECEAYLAFARDKQPKWEAIERAFFHRALRFGGRPDRIFRSIAGVTGPGVLEVKTGSEADWHGYQLAGYVRGKPRGSRWVLYLGKNGRYRLKMLADPDDHRTFLTALSDTWRIWPKSQPTT